jgi:hypothetical protein
VELAGQAALEADDVGEAGPGEVPGAGGFVEADGHWSLLTVEIGSSLHREPPRIETGIIP